MYEMTLSLTTLASSLNNSLTGASGFCARPCCATDRASGGLGEINQTQEGIVNRLTVGEYLSDLRSEDNDI